MSESSQIVWTCDRCGTEAVCTVSRQPQPKGWSSVIIVTPPRASTETARRMHLCGECDHDLGFFLNPPDRLDPVVPEGGKNE